MYSPEIHLQRILAGATLGHERVSSEILLVAGKAPIVTLPLAFCIEIRLQIKVTTSLG
jgi:hypothetical protein